MTAQRFTAQLGANTCFQEHGVGHAAIGDLCHHHTPGGVICHGVCAGLVCLLDADGNAVGTRFDTDLVHQGTFFAQHPSREVVSCPARRAIADYHCLDILQRTAAHIIGVAVPCAPGNHDGCLAIFESDSRTAAGHGQFICRNKVGAADIVIRNSRDGHLLDGESDFFADSRSRLHHSLVHTDRSRSGLHRNGIAGFFQSGQYLSREYNIGFLGAVAGARVDRDRAGANVYAALVGGQDIAVNDRRCHRTENCNGGTDRRTGFYGHGNYLFIQSLAIFDSGDPNVRCACRNTLDLSAACNRSHRGDLRIITAPIQRPAGGADHFGLHSLRAVRSKRHRGRVNRK